MAGKKGGAVAMKHAREWIAQEWPGDPALEAKKRVVWIPDKLHPGRRIPISTDEDIFGAFDLVVFHLREGGCSFIQVTTLSGKDPTSAVRTRRVKVRDNFLDRFPGARQQPNVYVIAWEPRQHFHAWRWNPERQEWLGPSVKIVKPVRKSPPARSPLEEGSPSDPGWPF